MSSPSLSAAQIERKISDLNRILSAARDLTRDGMHVDLDGLDAQVSQMCDALIELPAEQARPFSEPLQALIQQLDELMTNIQNMNLTADTASDDPTPQQDG